MDNEFKKFWQNEKKNFDLSKQMDADSILMHISTLQPSIELIILTVAYNCWTAARQKKEPNTMEFEQWWQLFTNAFDTNMLNRKELAKIAWDCATEKEKQEALKTIDQIINPETTYEFYKKNEDLV